MGCASGRMSRLFLAGALGAGLVLPAVLAAGAGPDPQRQTAILNLSMALDDLQAGHVQAGLVDLEAAETVLLNVKQSQDEAVNAMYIRVLHNIDQAHNALVRDDPDPAILLIQSAKAALEGGQDKTGAGTSQ